MERWRDAIGRSRHYTTMVASNATAMFAATMDWPDLESARVVLPPLWHWLGSGPIVPSADLGDDGHERLGIFIPDLPAHSRMWASGDVTWVAPIVPDEPIAVVSTIADIRHRHGRSGDLFFVDLDHHYRQHGTLRLEERQTLVYRGQELGRTRSPALQAERCTALATYRLSDRHLFRYSALTFNSHRIHLDRDYCVQFEGDSRLVVHGPLLATILVRSAGAVRDEAPAQFAFRAMHPVREGETFHACARLQDDGSVKCWIAGDDGTLRVEATAAY